MFTTGFKLVSKFFPQKGKTAKRLLRKEYSLTGNAEEMTKTFEDFDGALKELKNTIKRLGH